ncbi:S46 family peptidase [Massilia sp. TS11]|uniref:S46 family peptidase n=1 Tax=Massilia sp. TS11 TaxID=2908003 RepID=UPI001EDBA60D|nr:S46 family peptidase [Massilia sp. TS11]MCG2586687.1 S46 family peptidase [Massilia sp. TS11]
MKKSLLALALVSLYAQADEGMWMPQQLPEVAKQLKAAGLKLDPKSLSQLTEFPMGAIVSLGGCSASFVSPQGLVITNHHCVYDSVATNAVRLKKDLINEGFLAKSLAEELPASPGSRVFVTEAVTNVTDKVVTAEVKKLQGKARIDAMEKNIKALQSACEQEKGYRCNVPSFYGGLEFYLIKQMEIRDVRLVHAPPAGVGKFGGETDNWMWPRHTGDYGFYRAYVSKDGKSADYSKDNVPYKPKHYLKLAKDPVREGDFVMVAGYPGRTNRHRLPSEVEYTFTKGYPHFVQSSGETIATIEAVTKNRPEAAAKYQARKVAILNYYKNRKGMLNSYAESDFLQRKTAEHNAMKAWINSDAKRKAEYAADIEAIEALIAQRDAKDETESDFGASQPRLLGMARSLYRLANERQKPDAERKAGFQDRDLPRFQAGVQSVETSYDEEVDKALVMNSLKRYAALPAAKRVASFDAALGIKDGMSAAELKAVLDGAYAGSQLGSKEARLAWIGKTPADFKASNDAFIKAAVAMYEDGLKREAESEELSGKIQAAYANYMKAKLAYMKSLGKPVYPDANSTLRVTFGKVAGRDKGADGTTGWTAFTTVQGITAKHTGEGEFNAPEAELAAIRKKEYGIYADAKLKSVPVNFLATLDITGGNSGSAALNAKGELIGLAFDGTLDSIISDWDFNKAMTRDIQVDLRYILWNMKHVDKADNLLKEMNAL